MRYHKQHTLAKIQFWNGDEVITNVNFLRFIFGFHEFTFFQACNLLRL